MYLTRIDFALRRRFKLSVMPVHQSVNAVLVKMLDADDLSKWFNVFTNQYGNNYGSSYGTKNKRLSFNFPNGKS